MSMVHLVGFAEIGAYLREVRQSLGVDAQVAARAMHLRPNYLDALEAGDMAVLPGMAYARGYLSTYADYLQADKAMLLAAFDDAGKLRPDAPYCPEPTRRSARPGWGLLVVCVLALFGMMLAWQRITTPAPDTADATGPAEKSGLTIAAPARIAEKGTVVPQARQCLTVMKVGELAYQPPFCYWQPLPRWLGMKARMRYSTELEFPTYLIIDDAR